MKMSQSVRSAGGFTLIELMIGIGIIGVMSAVALYGWQGYRNNANLRTAARDIAADIAATRQKAASEGVRYRITFSTSANNYLIERGSAGGEPYVTVNTKSPTTLGAGSGLSITSANFSGGSQVTFYTRGTLSPGSVNLSNSKGKTATITVEFSGRTYVKFGP